MTTPTGTTTNQEGVKEMEAQETKNQEQELQKHKAAAAKAKAKKSETKKAPKKTAKAKAPKKAEIYVKPPHTKGIITTAHLEAEFGLKAKIIRRYLRKMDESTKPRGAQRYEWEASSKELKAIRANLEQIKAAMISNVR